MRHTYAVDEPAVLPRLEVLPPVSRVDPAPEVTLEQVCFDTDDLALARSGTSLNRRTADEGWRLTLPAGDQPEELQAASGADAGTVPDELRTLVQVRARGRPLVPVATIHRHRVGHRLTAEDGAALGELVDDRVVAEVTAGRDGVAVSGWRQWELAVEDEPLLEAAGRLLEAAGASRTTPGAPLARALGLGTPSSSEILEREPSEGGPAAVVVLAQLRQQVEELESRDPGVRRDLPDAVHKMRVASRRLRSALASFRPLLDRGAGDRLRAELRWLAEVLGEARDAEVMRDRLTALAAGDDPGFEPSSGTLAVLLDERYRSAHASVLEILDSPRYFRLLDALDRLLEEPPWEPAAERAARELLPARARREWRRVKAGVAAAEQATDERERDVALHEVRKAAKRLRYASEALVPAFGDPAADTGAAARRLQEVLGDYQDSVVSRSLLRELAAHREVSGDDALVLGRLHVLEQAHAERSRAQYQDAWEQLSRKRLRRWMRP